MNRQEHSATVYRVFSSTFASNNREPAFDSETIMVKLIQVCYKPNVTGIVHRKYALLPIFDGLKKINDLIFLLSSS